MIDTKKTVHAFQNDLSVFAFQDGMIALKIRHTFGMVQMAEYIALNRQKKMPINKLPLNYKKRIDSLILFYHHVTIIYCISPPVPAAPVNPLQ